VEGVDDHGPAEERRVRGHEDGDAGRALGGAEGGELDPGELDPEERRGIQRRSEARRVADAAPANVETPGEAE
jgi:hypothetical protein